MRNNSPGTIRLCGAFFKVGGGHTPFTVGRMRCFQTPSQKSLETAIPTAPGFIKGDEFLIDPKTGPGGSISGSEK